MRHDAPPPPEGSRVGRKRAKRGCSFVLQINRSPSLVPKCLATLCGFSEIERLFAKHYGREVHMHKFAWLELYQGRWHLMTGDPDIGIDRWTDKDLALNQLTEEGWTISGPYPKRIKANLPPMLRFQGSP